MLPLIYKSNTVLKQKLLINQSEITWFNCYSFNLFDKSTISIHSNT